LLAPLDLDIALWATAFFHHKTGPFGEKVPDVNVYMRIRDVVWARSERMETEEVVHLQQQRFSATPHAQLSILVAQ